MIPVLLPSRCLISSFWSNLSPSTPSNHSAAALSLPHHPPAHEHMMATVEAANLASGKSESGKAITSTRGLRGLWAFGKLFGMLENCSWGRSVPLPDEPLIVSCKVSKSVQTEQRKVSESLLNRDSR